MRKVARAVVLVLLTACGAGGASDGANGKSGPKAGGTTSPGFGATGKDSPAAASSPGGPTEVWSHSEDTLFKLDPVTKQVTVVGRFTGCTSVIDIALDANSNMFATTD